jgi:hypothetical protein
MLSVASVESVQRTCADKISERCVCGLRQPLALTTCARRQELPAQHSHRGCAHRLPPVTGRSHTHTRARCGGHAGCGAHEEDTWKVITIGGVKFNVPKPCSRCVWLPIGQLPCALTATAHCRCVLTTVNPDTGTRSKVGEPLETLRRTRTQPLDGKGGHFPVRCWRC